MVTTNGEYCVLKHFNFTETTRDKNGLTQKECDKEKTDTGESCRTIYISTKNARLFNRFPSAF